MITIISFIILLSYTAYYLLRVGLLTSHSGSYLALGKQGLIFQVVMVFLGMASGALMFQLSEGYWFQFS